MADDRSYNYARGLGKQIKNPRFLFTSLRIDGDEMGEGYLPMGDLSVEIDAVEYMIGMLRGRVWWCRENPNDWIEVDVTNTETGEQFMVVRRNAPGWTIEEPKLSVAYPVLQAARAALETSRDELSDDDLYNVIAGISALLAVEDRKNNEEVT